MGLQSLQQHIRIGTRSEAHIRTRTRTRTCTCTRTRTCTCTRTHLHTHGRLRPPAAHTVRLPLTTALPVTHPPILESRSLSWADEAACAGFARRLAAQVGINQAFIALHGPLGAGKTTFVRHLLGALGVQGRIKSPTYAVLEPHSLPDGSEVSHFDFYRFNDPREWEDAGFRDIFARPGLKFAEWPALAGDLLPPPDLRLAIEPHDDDSRQVAATAHTALGVALLRSLPG